MNKGTFYWIIKARKARRALPYSAYQWKSWQCFVMNKIDFRTWRCECHYQAPYGKVIMGGCPKHD